MLYYLPLGDDKDAFICNWRVRNKMIRICNCTVFHVLKTKSFAPFSSSTFQGIRYKRENADGW